MTRPPHPDSGAGAFRRFGGVQRGCRTQKRSHSFWHPGWMQQWEYTQVSAHVNDIAGLVQKANDYGAYGWEVVGFASADKTFGLNEVMAVLKRPVDPLPLPDDLDAGWKPDPSGRWHLRYWDGAVWRHDVESSFDGKVVKGRDAPTLCAAYRVPPWEEVY